MKHDVLQFLLVNLALLWEYATPYKKIPKRDQLQSVIDHICECIMVKVGKTMDKSEVITKAEFKKFGEYVLEQWHATTEKCDKDGAGGPGKISAVSSIRS